MPRRIRKFKKSDQEQEVLTAQVIPYNPDPLPGQTVEDIRERTELLQLRVRARLDALDQMPPEERFDAVSTMTDEIMLRMADRILEREAWLDSADPAMREEALAFICSMQDQLNNIQRVRIQMFDVLGLNERKGFVLGKEVPKLLLPSATKEEFQKKYSNLAAQYGTPKGDA